MRARTVGERSLIAGAHIGHHLRVEVENADRTWKDLTNLDGINFLDAVEWSDSLDSPCGTFTLTLRREADSVSLSPLWGASPANRDNVNAYAPLLNAGRNVRFFADVTASGGSPVWKLVFKGRIDKVEWSGDPVRVTGRDLSGWLASREIESEAAYATGTPLAIETVMQEVIDDWPVEGGQSFTLRTPVSPGWMINNASAEPRKQAVKSVLEALQSDYALSIGWVCRQKYHADVDDFRLTFYEIPRGRVDTDDSFGPTEYQDITNLEMSDEWVRNRIYGSAYTTNGLLVETTYNDIASQDEYGVKFLQMSFAADDFINTQAELDGVIADAANDLSLPFIQQTMRTLFYWCVELGDRYTFLPNADHYDSAQVLNVVAYSHRFANGEGVTEMQCRGKAVGAYQAWHRKSTQTTAPKTFLPPTARLEEIASSSTSMTLSGWGVLGENSIGPFSWRYKEWTDGTVPEPAWPAVWQTGALPTSLVISRNGKLRKAVGFQVMDGAGMVSVPVYRDVPGRFDAVNSSGVVDRGVGMSDGDFAARSTTSTGSKLHSTLTDSRDAILNAHFRYGVDGPGGVVETSAQKFVHGNALDASRNVNFAASGVTNKFAANMLRASGGAALNAVIAQLSDAGHAASGMQDSRAALLNAMFRHGVDNTSGINGDVAGKRLVSDNEKTGAGRGYSALDSSNALVTRVGRTALIEGSSAYLTAKGGSGVFMETFDEIPPGWSNTANTTIESGGVTGSNVIRVTGAYRNWYGDTNGGHAKIPFDPTKLYRIRVRARVAVLNTDGSTETFYAGIRAVTGAGAALNRYMLWSGQALPLDGSWVERTGWLKGTGAAVSQASQSPTNPTGTDQVGTTHIAPLLLINYQTPDAQHATEVDYFAIDVFDEDGQSRTYTMLDGGANLGRTTSGAGDSRAALLNAMFRHGVDNTSGINGDVAGKRLVSDNEKTGGLRSFNAFDGTDVTPVLKAGNLDFSRAYTNKHAGNIPRASGSAVTTATAISKLADTGDAASGMNDSRSAPLNAHFRHGVDNTSGINGDVAGKRLVSDNEKTGAARGYTAIDSGGVVITGAIDFSRTYTNKHAGNIPRASGSAVATSTAISRLADTGNAASTMADSRNEPLNAHFRYGVDGVAGVVESSTQKFVHGDYLDASRRPKQLMRSAGDTAITADQLVGSMGESPENMIRNGGAQGSNVGEGISIAGPWIYGTGEAFIADSAQARFGDRSMRCSHVAGAYSSAYQDGPTVNVGDVLELTVYVRPQGTSGAGVSGALMAIAGNEIAGAFTILGAVSDMVSAGTYAPATISAGTSDWKPLVIVARANLAGPLRVYVVHGFGGNLSGTVYIDGIVVRKRDPSTAVGGYRAATALDDNSRLTGQRRQVMVNIGGIVAKQFLPGTATPLTTPLSTSSVTDGFGVVHHDRIVIAAHDLVLGSGGVISYNQQTFLGNVNYGSPATLVRNYVVLNDPAYAGGSPTPLAFTNAKDIVANDGYYYVGQIDMKDNGAGSGSTCPAFGTPVRLSSGRLIDVEKIVPGMIVYTQHEHTLEWCAAPVTQVTHWHDQPLVRVCLEDGRRVEFTPLHRVFVDGKGWTHVATLLAGDCILGESPGIVQGIEDAGTGSVVRMCVDGAHTYQTLGLLSHNKKEPS